MVVNEHRQEGVDDSDQDKWESNDGRQDKLLLAAWAICDVLCCHNSNQKQQDEADQIECESGLGRCLGMVHSSR